MVIRVAIVRDTADAPALTMRFNLTEGMGVLDPENTHKLITINENDNNNDNNKYKSYVNNYRLKN